LMKLRRERPKRPCLFCHCGDWVKCTEFAAQPAWGGRKRTGEDDSRKEKPSPAWLVLHLVKSAG
jgi:hypothetical protein